MIRDGLLTSSRYERLSSDAKLFYFHLLLCADDLGCIELGATYVRRRILFSQDSDERISKLINELHDVDLLRPYTVDRTCYGFIPRFGQRVQVKYAKYPLPPDALFGDDLEAVDKFTKIKENNNDIHKSTVVQRMANGCPTDGQRTVSGKREVLNTLAQALRERFEKFWKSYPRKKSKADAEKAWAKINPSEQLVATMLAAIEQAKTSVDWTKERGQFIPYPATWLNKRCWEDEVVERPKVLV